MSNKIYAPALDERKIEKLRQWMHDERSIRGWGATKLAREASAAAKRQGVELSLKQQSVSALELGYMKSIPKWINYVAAAFEDNPPPAGLENIESVKCKRSTEFVPNEVDLNRMLLGLLAPMEIDPRDPWSLKQKIASSLAKRLPIAMKQPQLYADI